METSSFTIPAPKLKELQKKIRAWSHKATKAGLGTLEVHVSEETTKVHYVVLEDIRTGKLYSRPFLGFNLADYPGSNISFHQCREYHTVTLPTTIPSFNGYELISVLDHTSKTGNIIAQVARETTTPEKYRSTGSFCDHCNTNRLRNTTLVLRSPEGDFKQIGKSCVKLYLQSDVNALIAMADMWPEMYSADEDFDMDDEEWCTSGRFDGESTLAYLAKVSSCISTCGWAARSSGSDNPTANMAQGPISVTAQDKTIAANAIEWARNINPEGNNFLSNLKILAHEEVFSYKQAGTVAYIVQGYLKHTSQEKVRQDREAQPKSTKYLGDKGAKINFSGIVTRYWVAEHRDSYDNYRAMVEITTDDGSKAVWWTTTSSRGISDVSTVGTVVDVTARVKACEEYRDQCQTIINRPTFNVLEEAC